ncbi:hypothetical protein ACC754_45120, partial [Rhizobium johnstonii]
MLIAVLLNLQPFDGFPIFARKFISKNPKIEIGQRDRQSKARVKTLRHATTFPRVDFLVVDFAGHNFIKTTGM